MALASIPGKLAELAPCTLRIADLDNALTSMSPPEWMPAEILKRIRTTLAVRRS